MSEGALVLADGTTFIGTAVGATGAASGEVVFNTAMSGYQEIATDPSYAGQIIAMTAPHIGNYGTNQDDEQADRTWCSGFVVRSMSRRESSWRSEGSFQAWLVDRGIVGLADIDTRRLTRHIRSFGAMPAAIGSNVPIGELRVAAQQAPTMDGRDLTKMVTTDEPYRVGPTATIRGRVVAIDFGIKRDIIRSLVQRGLEVVVVPSDTPASDILERNPNGVFLSNGPGDPAPVAGATATVRALLGHVPVFGICLGHQILGRALGAATYKLPFGHHGGNHPVRRLKDGRVAITAQNHGFAVDLRALTEPSRPSSLEGSDASLAPPVATPTAYGPVVPTHQNLNDGTLEGLELPDAKAFSVQYHPEAAPGPSEASALFDQFVALMEIN